MWRHLMHTVAQILPLMLFSPLKGTRIPWTMFRSRKSESRWPHCCYYARILSEENRKNKLKFKGQRGQLKQKLLRVQVVIIWAFEVYSYTKCIIVIKHTSFQHCLSDMLYMLSSDQLKLYESYTRIPVINYIINIREQK